MDDTYTVITPYGIVRATFPDDAGIAMEGHEDAQAAVRRAILASLDERGMGTTPEALDPDRFVQWCQGPDSAIVIVPPALDGMDPEPPPHPDSEDADMQEAATLDAVDLSSEEHKRCMQAYEDYYHKVAAETSPKLWLYVWSKALAGAVSGGSTINIHDGVEELPGMRAAIAAATNPLERIALVKAMKAAQAAWEASRPADDIDAKIAAKFGPTPDSMKPVVERIKAYAAETGKSVLQVMGPLVQIMNTKAGFHGHRADVMGKLIDAGWRVNEAGELRRPDGKSYFRVQEITQAAMDYAKWLQEKVAPRKFTDLSPDEQRAQIAAEKKAVTDEQVDQFLATWGQASADYVATGFRVAGIVPGIGYVQLMKGEATPQLTTPDGDSSVNLNPEQLADLHDAIRSGALDIEVFRRWGNGADARSPVKMLYRGNATFKPFDYAFELLSRTGSDMDGLTAEQRRRTEEALKETEAMLAKQLAYGPDLQKPMQIEWYTAHAEYLRAVLAGTAKVGEGAKPTAAQNADWDTTAAVLAERARQATEPAGRVLERRNVWIPNMTPSKLDRLLQKVSRTADDIEDLKDFRYFLLNDQQSAAEKGFMTGYKADGGAVLVLKNKFWLTNIEAAIEAFEASAEAPQGLYPFRYALVNRPADLGTIPKGVAYTVEPRPAAGQPHADMARHGILTTERELTAEELKAFELAPLVDGEDLGVMAEAIARGMSEYAAAYLEQATEDPEYFKSRVMEGAKSASSGITYSIGDPKLLVQMVRDKLAAMVPAAGQSDAKLGADMQFLQEVADGKHPAMLEPELADDIEAAINRHPGDAGLQAIGERAIIAYSNSLMAATGSA